MPEQNNFFHINSFLLTLILVTPTVLAAQDELCAPFKNAKVDSSLIETMLKAANNNHLYRIDSSSSNMKFCVDSSIGRVEGSFNNFQGGLALNDTGSQTMVSIDVNSLQTNLLFIEKLLKGDGFFNAESHPELIFVSTSFEWLSETRAVLKGNLSMHGITKEVAFYVEIFELDGDLSDTDTILVKATTTIKRSEFGMTSLSSMVGDKVNLCMSIEAKRYNPATV